MNKTNTKLPEIQAPDNKTNWFSRHHMWGYAFLLFSFLLAVAFIYQMQYGRTPEETQICIQVVTRAKNIQTGDAKDFPTPCDVPEGWEREFKDVVSNNIIPVDTTNWFEYKHSFLGLEMSFPSQSEEEDIKDNSFRLYYDKDRKLQIAQVRFLNDRQVDKMCEQPETYKENGWSVSKSSNYYCAHNGVYRIRINFTHRYPGIDEKILESIKINQSEKLIQPKYYLYCFGDDPFSETSSCDLYSNGSPFIKNFMGGKDKVLPHIAIYSNYRIIGWNDDIIVLKGGAGDACWSKGKLFEINISTLKATEIDSYDYNCPQTPETESAAEADLKAYNDHIENIKKSLILYPEIIYN
jgi:hypothetical protein